jgi:glutaredoxin
MIEVYGKPDCVWCEKAKSLLESRNIPFNYFSVGEDVDLELIKEKFPGVKSVPIITVDGFRIGGYESLQGYLEETAGGFGDGAF